MKNLFRIWMALAVLCLFFACGKGDQKANSDEAKVFTDAMQRQVSVPQPVKRIVSMAPNNTEMLFAIGLDEKIVGVTDFCNYPEKTKTKYKIGGYFTPNIEAILSLRPDIIIATPDGYNSKEGIGKLDSTGLSVFIVNPQSIDEILETMLTLGKVTGKEDAASKVVEKLSSRVRAVREKVATIPEEMRPKVFYEIGHDPIITAGPETFVDNIITEAGGKNIATDAKTNWPRYNVEAIITKEPDIIITAPHVRASDDEKETRMDTWKRFRTIPAIQNNRIYPMDPDVLLRAGPRAISGLEELHGIFDKFWKNQENIGTE